MLVFESDALTKYQRRLFLSQNIIWLIRNWREKQIVFALKQNENSVPVAEITRRQGVTEATFYRWKKQYGGLMLSEVHKLKQLQEENARLKRPVSDLSLDNQMLQDVLGKKF